MNYNAKMASLISEAIADPYGVVQCQHTDSHAWYDLSVGNAEGWATAPEALAEAIRLGIEPHRLRIDPTPF